MDCFHWFVQSPNPRFFTEKDHALAFDVGSTDGCWCVARGEHRVGTGDESTDGGGHRDARRKAHAAAGRHHDATASGKPLSARYEFEDGKLKLSVFVEKAGAYSELFFDHMTGKVAQVDKITDGDDLKDAKAQSKVSAKATKSLAAALTKALGENPGYIAVEVTPILEGKHAVAEITLMKDGQFKGVSEPIA